MSEPRIIVLMKEVPDIDLVTISDEGRLERENVPSVADPFCMMALGHAIRMKKDMGAHVTAVTMGPPHAEGMMRRCLEYGTDEAILLTDRAFAGADTLATARALGCFLKGQNYDYVFCGVQATDGDTGQVPPELSSILGIPIYSYVSDIDLTDGVRMTQMYEDECLVIDAPPKAVVSFIRYPETNIPLPSMTDFIDARKKDVTVMNAWMLGMPLNMIGSKGSRTRVTGIATVLKRKKEPVFIEGNDVSLAAKEILKEVGI